MAGKAQKFRMDVSQWQAATEAQLDALARQVCLRMAELVVEKTPPLPDTGFYRGSWQPSIGLPSTETGEEDPTGSAAQAAIAATVTDMKAGEVFYMRNNAAYALRLEYGFVGQDSLGRTYDQAGYYMVTDTVKAWQAVAGDVVAELGLGKKK